MATSNPEGARLHETLMNQNHQKVSNFVRKLDESAENMMETPNTGAAIRPFQKFDAVSDSNA